jgi:hypothetical protein
MGYTSDLCIALKDKVVLEAVLKKNFPRILGDPKSCEITEHDGATYYEIFNVKWYEDYPDVQEVDSFLNALEDEDFGFIRAGENNDDTEERGDPAVFELWVDRRITTPFG